MYAKPGCYFLRSVVNGRTYILGGESDGQCLLCIWTATGGISRYINCT